MHPIPDSHVDGGAVVKCSELIKQLQDLMDAAQDDPEVTISTENREESIHTVWLSLDRIIIEN